MQTKTSEDYRREMKVVFYEFRDNTGNLIETDPMVTRDIKGHAIGDQMPWWIKKNIDLMLDCHENDPSFQKIFTDAELDFLMDIDDVDDFRM